MPPIKETAHMLNDIPPETSGALMAMFIAAIRVIYDREETKPIRVILESLICGALSLTASAGITAMGFDMSWSVFAGGTIGYFGSATVRALAVKIIRRKVG